MFSIFLNTWWIKFSHFSSWSQLLSRALSMKTGCHQEFWAFYLLPIYLHGSLHQIMHQKPSKDRKNLIKTICLWQATMILVTADCLRSPKEQVSYTTCSIQVVGWWPSPHSQQSRSRTRRCKFNSCTLALPDLQESKAHSVGPHCDDQCVAQISHLPSPFSFKHVIWYILILDRYQINLPFLTQWGIAKGHHWQNLC